MSAPRSQTISGQGEWLETTHCAEAARCKHKSRRNSLVVLSSIIWSRLTGYRTDQDSVKGAARLCR
ncbi:hypothetical protein N7533_009258 [Penicillium manginii]|uniref:uncharacterized protein n=1 Tax=Penicillium manginii TaxID=203109 RepID=UPI0025495737|nr:uncharacterized protein N7533_009258 [Penicillium manginii]KAJ5744388.1 hypothetical protein N7533_009258 [Penicillium manginii]